jgi:hypothetical protein
VFGASPFSSFTVRQAGSAFTRRSLGEGGYPVGADRFVVVVMKETPREDSRGNHLTPRSSQP